LGFLLHYLYSWTGNSKIIGLVVPVNESVWEHLKLGYLSVVLLSFVEFFQIRSRVNNYFFARIVGILAFEVTIILIFYSHTLIIGENIFLIDIFSYMIGAIVCQHITYMILRLQPFHLAIQRIGLAAIIAMGVLFGVTTYYPPHIAIFQDNNDKTFGINKEK
jgi:hypothetical protein